MTLEAGDEDELQLKGLTRELQNSWMQRSRIDKLDCRLYNGLSSSKVDRHEVDRTVVWQIEVSFKIHDC